MSVTCLKDGRWKHRWKTEIDIVTGRENWVCQNMKIIQQKERLFACILYFRGEQIYKQSSRGDLRAAQQTISRTRAYLAKVCLLESK